MALLQKRIQEIVDFATTESPNRSANKGWITDDVYLQLGSMPDKSSEKGKEFADIVLYWNPINQIVLGILFALFLATILVVTSISLVSGEFQLLKAEDVHIEGLALSEPQSESVAKSTITSEVTQVQEVIQPEIDVIAIEKPKKPPLIDNGSSYKKVETGIYMLRQ